MKVRELMTAFPYTVRRHQTLQEVVDLMSRHGFRHVPVVEGDAVIGILSYRDLMVSLGQVGKALDVEALERMELDGTVGAYMTHPVFTVSETADVTDACALVLEHRISALPVTDDEGALTGILTTFDLVALLAKLVDDVEF